MNGVVAQRSTLSLFTRWLEQEYDLYEQDSAGVAFDKFFNFKRGPRDLGQYIVDLELVYGEAQDQAGWMSTAVSRSDLLLQGCDHYYCIAWYRFVPVDVAKAGAVFLSESDEVVVAVRQ